MNIEDFQAYKLSILSTLGLNIEGCNTSRSLSKRILAWLKQDKQRMKNFKDNTAKRWVETFLDGTGDMTAIALGGLKGLNDFDNNDWIHEIEYSHLWADDSKDFIDHMKEMINEEE